MILNETAKAIACIPPAEIKLDRQIKKVLACKPILSRILSAVIEECNGMTYNEVEACIEGNVLVEQVPMEPGYTNMIGLSQEDSELGEGLIRYDIRTYLKLPNCEIPQLAKILIDVEAQKDEDPGYDIPIRGLYYCCRMISSQLMTEFTVATNDTKKYDNIKKVYSIWICTETSQKRANSIEEYGKTDHELIRFLTDLFNDEMPVQEKLRILHATYHLSITEEIEKEVTEMCTYTASVKQRGIQEGENRLSNLIQLLITAGRTEDIAKATSDADAREKFYSEFGITN